MFSKQSVLRGKICFEQVFRHKSANYFLVYLFFFFFISKEIIIFLFKTFALPNIPFFSSIFFKHFKNEFVTGIYADFTICLITTMILIIIVFVNKTMFLMYFHNSFLPFFFEPFLVQDSNKTFKPKIPQKRSTNFNVYFFGRNHLGLIIFLLE